MQFKHLSNISHSGCTSCSEQARWLRLTAGVKGIAYSVAIWLEQITQTQAHDESRPDRELRYGVPQPARGEYRISCG